MEVKKKGSILLNWLWPVCTGCSRDQRIAINNLRLKRVVGTGIIFIVSLWWGVTSFLDSHWYLEQQFDYVSNVIPERGTRSMYLLWVDDRTLVFQGHDGTRLEKGERWPKPGTYKLYRWRLGETEEDITDPELSIRLHTPMKGGGYCVNRGQIRYNVDSIKLPEGGYEYTVRQLTSEGIKEFSEVVLPNKVKGYPALVRKRIPGTCKTVERFDLGHYRWQIWPDSETVLVLASESGMKVETIQPFILHPNGQRVELEIPPNEFLSVSQYVPFNNSFLLSDITWSKLACIPYWVVSKDGKAVRNCFPRSDFGKNKPDRIYFTKKGLFFLSNANRGGGSLRVDGKLIKILHGNAKNVVVSPNGCLVAFNYLKSWREKEVGKRGWRVAVIDVCKIKP